MKPMPAFRTLAAPEARLTGAVEGAAVAHHEGGEGSTIYLHPGQIFASAEPCAVTTILGSCVAVCLWDPHLRVGGANHFLLPDWAGNGHSSARFGNVAIERLIEKVVALGGKRENLQAKLFGGACVIEAFRDRENHLGMKNVQVARRLLEKGGIPVIAEDVGGRQGRKLIFHVNDGTAWVRRL